MKEPDSDLKHIPELMAGFLQTLAPVSPVSFSYIEEISYTIQNTPTNTHLVSPSRSPGPPTPTYGSTSNPAVSTTSCNTRSQTP